MLNNRTLAPQELVQSLANITGLQDRDDLAVSMCLTVYEMLPVMAIRFYRTVVAGNGTGLGLLVEFDEHGVRQHSLAASSGRSSARPETDPWLQGVLMSESALHVAPGGECLIMHLRRKGEIYALLDIRVHEGLEPSDLRLLQGIARIYENHIALLDYGETDTLTGLLNRKTLERQYFKIVTALQNLPAIQSQGTGRRQDQVPAQYFLAVFDIDHFKQINDRLGHLFGDEVLLLVAQLMRSSFRSDDCLFRYGGEEFVVILGPQSREGVMLALERFREQVEQHDFPQIGRVTLSGGIAAIQPFEVLSMTLGRADQALYEAKSSGRNRMVFSEPPPAADASGSAGDDTIFF
ncbi:GGDEF domain-containing protein [Chitinilyticum piscinae]|uniref:diguanylate cyclase n=1 Tax=Chitinilyticum piscinae TaxID=2866724 RepID=A0A8J7FJ10_9NEIS|nr:GGDEF domain-containing protein [Chitinilyticum piscinae]MBE9610225.1 GGDEF domain-containing protein [Chitinilyticum piscinae]